MKYLVYALFALTGSMSHATELDLGDITEAYAACASSAKSNQGMKECAAQAWVEADGVLNVVYKELRASISSKEVTTRLVTAQRTWITYRDQNCRLQAANAIGGTMESLIFIDCKFEATKARALELQALIGTL